MKPIPRNYKLMSLIILLTAAFAIPSYVAAKEHKLTRYTLPNGLNVIIQKDPARKVATIQYWVLVGSADENDSQHGISHLIEHMAFKGTQKRKPGQIAEEIEALGGSTNAYTSWDRTVFHVTVPSQKVQQGLEILTDAVLNPAIDPTELKKEKQVVLEEILEGDERPQRKASKLLFETAYTNSPYHYPVIGYKETVSKFTRDDILNFRKKWYVPQNMFVVIVGDVDPAKLRPEIEKLTASFRPAAFVAKARQTEPEQKKIRGATLRDSNTRETLLKLAFHIPSARGADANVLDLTANILGARESSRLVRVIKKEKQLVHSISAYAVTPRDSGLFLISASLDAKNLEATTKAVMDELRKLAERPPSAEELDRAKTDVESSYLYDRQTVGGIARDLGSFEADMGDAAFEEIYLKLNDAVTAQQIAQVVRTYLRPSNATVTVLLPEKDVPEFQMAHLTDIVESYASDKRSVASAGASQEVVTETLPNGMRVVLIHDSSNPIVSFRIACLGGKRFETEDTQGIMNFVAQMLDKGTESMSEVDIAQKIEDMGGRLGTFSGHDSVGLDGTFFSRNIADGLALLADLYAHPAFPQDKMERERKLIINRIETAPDRPIQFAVRTLDEAMYSRHPYGFNKDGTVETVKRFTRDDLLRTHGRFFVPANTVITGVGDMNVKDTLNLIRELFGAIPDKKLAVPNVPPEEPITKVREKTVRLPRAKAHLLIGFRGTTLKSEDRYALDVLNSLLAGMGGRLFRELRDKESLAYTVAPFVRPAVDPGLIAFYIATDSAKVDKAITGLVREIKRVKKAPPKKEELERAINNVVGRRQIALQSPWARAENVALNDLYGLGPDYEPEYLKRIAEVTPDQVLQAARRYLDMDRAVIVKILPEKS